MGGSKDVGAQDIANTRFREALDRVSAKKADVEELFHMVRKDVKYANALIIVGDGEVKDLQDGYGRLLAIEAMRYQETATRTIKAHPEILLLRDRNDWSVAREIAKRHPNLEEKVAKALTYLKVRHA